MTPASTQPIIFFDGVCGLCNRFVDKTMRRDQKQVFLFAPIQGETAKQLLGSLPENSEDWSIIYLDEDGAHDRSTAVLKIYSRLGGIYQIMGVFLILPAGLRNWFYTFIAKRRYRWYGKLDACRIPNEAEKQHFLP